MDTRMICACLVMWARHKYHEFCRLDPKIDYGLILSSFLSLFHKLRNFVSIFSGFYLLQITELICRNLRKFVNYYLHLCCAGKLP